MFLPLIQNNDTIIPTKFNRMKSKSFGEAVSRKGTVLKIPNLEPFRQKSPAKETFGGLF